MPGYRRRLWFGGGGAATALIALALAGAATPSATAAGAPIMGEVWASTVFANSARLHVQLDPNGLSTGYRIDYLTKAAYDANVAGAKDPFSGALRSPLKNDANIGSTKAVVGQQQLFSLSPDTAYRYRVVATNSGGKTTSATLPFATQPLGTGETLPDSRVWELVSPIDKNGGQVDPPETLSSGGVLQAAASGGSVTYSSAASFGSAQGAPPASQYVSSRDANGNWITENITAALFSGSYGLGDEGVPYRLFSADLARGVMLNGRRCRSEGSDCSVANPPVPGTDAPANYQNYYLREGANLSALLGADNSGFLALEPDQFELTFAGAAPDLRHGVLSTCAALTANATEVTLGAGCDPSSPNLYEYSPAGGLVLVNLLPAQMQGTPGAALAAQAGAVSADGSRVYWRSLPGGSLYLREGAQTKLVDAEGTFETASADGSVAYFTKNGHLYRYQASGGGVTDLTPGGGVQGVLGTSTAGDTVYYLTASGLFRRNGATTTSVAVAADASNYPPTTGTARVSADGTRLLFMSTTPLTDHDTKKISTGLPTSQVYLYESPGAGTLRCISCNPTFARPIGSSRIPGAIANGSGPAATHSYKPRILSGDARRVYFESEDALVGTDTNEGATDVYQWEAQGTGTCTGAGGCLALMSSGRNIEGAKFVDASADGNDVYFLIDEALSALDLPGSLDLYDARVDGLVAQKSTEIVCVGDACQPPPEEAVDPPIGTQRKGPGNPAVNFQIRKCRKGFVKHRGKCMTKKAKRKAQRRSKRHRRGGR